MYNGICRTQALTLPPDSSCLLAAGAPLPLDSGILAAVGEMRWEARNKVDRVADEVAFDASGSWCPAGEVPAPARDIVDPSSRPWRRSFCSLPEASERRDLDHDSHPPTGHTPLDAHMKLDRWKEANIYGVLGR
jgi:hypothetical protein